MMKKLQQAYKRLAVSILVMFGLAIMPVAAMAGNTTWSANTNVEVTGSITLVILADSESDSVVVDQTAGTLLVTVADGETFTLRYPGASPGNLANDGGLVGCTYVSGNNETIVNGPKTVTFTPTATPVCTATVPSSGGGGGGATYTAPYISLTSPDGGGTVSAGSSHQITWSAGGTGLSGIRLKLSTNSGATYPTTIVSSTSNDSSHSWTVPNISTTTARIKAEVVNSLGSSLAFDESAANFTITGTTAAAEEEEPAAEEPAAEAPTAEEVAALEAAAPAVDPTSTGTYNATEATEATPTIATDLGLLDEPTPEETPACEGGTLIKGSTDAVYYCGADGKRYVFPNQHIYNTWYADFSSVITVTDAVLASAQLGGNVTYKPGVRMIKITSDPKTYAVSRGGYLRWVQTEEVAVALYGAAWNTKIDDVDPAFFFNYSIGDPITVDDI